MHPIRTVLLIEDDDAHVELIRRAFERTESPPEIWTANTVARAVERLEAGIPDVIVTDWRLPDGRGTDCIARSGSLPCPVIVMAGQGDEKTAVEAMKAGALDYIVKSDVTFSEMPRIVARTLREWTLMKERQQLEADLQVSQRMEAVGRLAGGVAHDFNNLLTIIGTYAEFAQETTDDPVLRDMLGEIQNAQGSAAQLTRQLLAFGGRQVMAPVVLDLNLAVRGVGGMLERVMGGRFRIDLRLDRELAMIEADSTQLEQVIVNLFMNARDAMPEGGEITVTSKNVTVEASVESASGHLRPGEYVRLRIRDSGIGMEEEVLERIFDPFFTTKPRGRGTGLGLSSAFGIVRQLGGDIVVRSKPGSGTVFDVFLPPSESQAVTPDRLGGGESAGGLDGTETILLAEDDEVIRGLVVQMLRRRGYRVLIAEDGAEALELAEAHPEPVDLLLSDIVMPRKNGYELAVELRERQPRLRTLFISGYIDESVPPEQLRDTRVTFLAKPFTSQTLCKTVREILDADIEAKVFSHGG